MADFQGLAEQFAAKNIALIAASTDTLAEARATVDKEQLTFPVAYGLDPREVSDALGAFYSPEKGCLHATNILVKPDGTIACASYSTGPIGRFTAADALGFASHLMAS